MIHIFVGTKAQFIKMAPIMRELQQRGVPYNFIDAGQHGGLTGDLVEQFELRPPDVYLRRERNNISTLWQAAVWTGRNLKDIVFRPRQVRERLFRNDECGICLIHGDTLTTLLSLLYARRSGLQVGHVEAGLRSYNLLDPFPEEAIRLLAMRLSHLLFAPSDWAYDNLYKMGYEQKTEQAGGNTVEDTVRFALERADAGIRPAGPYALITSHRVETIYSRKRMTIVAELAEKISAERDVLFVLHEPTRQQLNRFGLAQRLERNARITLCPLQPYLAFVALIAGADYVVTDGGSIQEECHYLGIPCLIIRSRTERQEGLGENAMLAAFDRGQIATFLAKWPTLRREPPCRDTRPSQVIVDRVMEWV